MIAALALLLLGGAEPNKTIVVEAPRTAQALADCLARKCGIREDAVASIRHAQAQFAQGSYPQARKTLLASLDRNRSAGSRDPRAMSALWYALARVTLHNGDMEEYRRAAFRSGSILARAESITPSERLKGEIQIASAMAVAGDAPGAARRYRKLGNRARANGDVELAQLMELRAKAAHSTIDGRPAARRAMEQAAADPNLVPRARMAALALAAQLQDGKPKKIEALLAAVPVHIADGPAELLWAPQDRFTIEREGRFNAGPVLAPMVGNSPVRLYSWADIGFWVRPNGRVEEAEVLRGSNDRAWIKEALRVVKGRRYAPFQAAGGVEGEYRIERVTLTYDWIKPTGSLIRRRGGQPSFQFEELKIEGETRPAG